MPDLLADNELMAAIDLGSNSFHLAIARLDHGEVRKLASMSEKVQLAAGLDGDNYLSEEAQQRGLDCLARFVGRLDAVAEPALELLADEIAPFGVSDLGVEHADEGFVLLELLVVTVDALLPSDEFIVEAAQLRRFVLGGPSGFLIERACYVFRERVEQAGVGSFLG